MEREGARSIEEVARVAAALARQLETVSTDVQGEIERAIPQLRGDQAAVALLAPSVAENISTIVHMLEHGIEAGLVAAPSAAMEYAAPACPARRGVGCVGARLPGRSGPVHPLVRRGGDAPGTRRGHRRDDRAAGGQANLPSTSIESSARCWRSTTGSRRAGSSTAVRHSRAAYARSSTAGPWMWIGCRRHWVTACAATRGLGGLVGRGVRWRRDRPQPARPRHPSRSIAGLRRVTAVRAVRRIERVGLAARGRGATAWASRRPSPRSRPRLRGGGRCR